MTHDRRIAVRGFTLIELMVSMVLGLIVVGGALSIIASNKQSYRTNEALSQLQESARSAFELLARDIRQAGATGCDNTGRVGSVLKDASLWWQDWVALKGYTGTQSDPAAPFGAGEKQRVQGTDSIQIRSTEGMGMSIASHKPSSATFELQEPSTTLKSDDILMVCDFDHATIFQVTGYNDKNVTVIHNTGEGNLGNQSKGLGYPPSDETVGNVYEFGPNSQLARLSAIDWYIGNNGRPSEGGRSLFRRRLGAEGNDAIEEIVAGVSNLTLAYRVAGTENFVAASTLAAADWDRVTSVRITFVVTSADQRVSSDSKANAGRLERTFTNIVTLRNRVP